MHRKLPNDLNLHIFSFLSAKELGVLKTTKKDNNKLGSYPLLWKALIKHDFCVTDFKEIKNFQPEYEQLFQKYKQEKECLTDYLLPVIYSLKIKQQIISEGKSNELTATHDHEVRMADFDEDMMNLKKYR